MLSEQMFPYYMYRYLPSTHPSLLLCNILSTGLLDLWPLYTEWFVYSKPTHRCSLGSTVWTLSTDNVSTSCEYFHETCIYCRSGNIRENLIFADIRELVASRI